MSARRSDRRRRTIFRIVWVAICQQEELTDVGKNRECELEQFFQKGLIQFGWADLSNNDSDALCIDYAERAG